HRTSDTDLCHQHVVTLVHCDTTDIHSDVEPQLAPRRPRHSARERATHRSLARSPPSTHRRESASSAKQPLDVRERFFFVMNLMKMMTLHVCRASEKSIDLDRICAFKLEVLETSPQLWSHTCKTRFRADCRIDCTPSMSKHTDCTHTHVPVVNHAL